MLKKKLKKEKEYRRQDYYRNGYTIFKFLPIERSQSAGGTISLLYLVTALSKSNCKRFPVYISKTYL